MTDDETIEFTTPIEVLIHEHEEEPAPRPAVAPLVPAPYGEPVPLNIKAQVREERAAIWGWIGCGAAGVLLVECLALVIWAVLL